MRQLKPELFIVGETSVLVLRTGNGGKASLGADGQCTGMDAELNCSLSEIDD